MLADAPVQAPLPRNRRTIDLVALHKILKPLAEEGKTNTEIGRALGVSHETARQYLIATHLFETRKAQCAELKNRTLTEWHQKKQAMREVRSLVRARRRALAQQAGWAIEKAVAYYDTLKWESQADHTFHRLVHFFEQYAEAQQHGRTPSLRELGATIGIVSAEVGDILREVGLTPFHTTWPYKPRLPADTFARAFSLPLTVSDLSYFLQLSHEAIYARFHKIGERPDVPDLPIRPPGKLPYRLASQIYQADDWRLPDGTPENLASLLGTKPAVVRYAQDHRTEIEPIIVYALHVLFPEKRISTPYVP